MAKILIMGAGRIGTAFAKIVRHVSSDDVVLVDPSEEALEEARADLVAPETAAGTLSFHVGDVRDMPGLVAAEEPDLIASCVPFHACAEVARAAVAAGVHYLDFTEDVAVTAAISKLHVNGITVVPQTGLAPGLISYVGLSLAAGLGEPQSLVLRVGALPQVSFGPSFYAITWSPDGLINEYLQPTQRKKSHIIQDVPPLDDLEHICIDGVMYEAFTTSGGVGNLDAYSAIPDVEYKTIRHPGHLDFIQKLLSKADDHAHAVELARSAFPTTQQDRVVLLAVAVDRSGRQVSKHLVIHPHAQLGLTALELSTAGTGVMVAELILKGLLPTGVLLPSQIPLSLISGTLAYRLIGHSLS
jgi:saccharopine dehydrogenase-like NADP-dependent oxidoreductase